MIRRQVANEIINRDQSQLWLESTKTLRTRISDLEQSNRLYQEENRSYRAYLKEIGVDTTALLLRAKAKKEETISKKKKVVIRAGDHDSLSDSDTVDSETALEE